MAAEIIHHAIRPTSLGPISVAATRAGICHLAFANHAERLRADHPGADIREECAASSALFDAAAQAVEEPMGDHDIPLDLFGTPFQLSVWEALRAIPCGETRTYGGLAALLGSPGASRAVGAANGANRIAVLVPCHRVVQADGSLGGYAYGLNIKRELLRREGACIATRPQQASLFA